MAIGTKSTLTRSLPQKPILQTSRLLALPSEIQQKVFDHIFDKWSLAVFSTEEEVQAHSLDDTISPVKVGERLVSGPPGCNLLLVCRQIYNDTRLRYGESCTGRLLLGKIKGKTRRKLPQYLKTHPVFQCFYIKIHTVYARIALTTRQFDLDFRTLFPNIRYADCIVHEASYGPIVRLGSSIQNFLRGNDARELSDWTQPIVNYFLCSDRRWIRAVHSNQCPWSDEGATVSVKVLGTVVDKKGVAVGYNYHWIGPRQKIASLIVRNGDEMMYWEAGMVRGDFKVIDISIGEQAIPSRFRWVKMSKW